MDVVSIGLSLGDTGACSCSCSVVGWDCTPGMQPVHSAAFSAAAVVVSAVAAGLRMVGMVAVHLTWGMVDMKDLVDLRSVGSLVVVVAVADLAAVVEVQIDPVVDLVLRRLDYSILAPPSFLSLLLDLIVTLVA